MLDGEACGLFLFADVGAAISAERALRSAGHEARLVSPPGKLRRGCDLAVAVRAVERPGAERLLDEKSLPRCGWADHPEGCLDLVDVVAAVDLGEWLMVRAGAMKITVERSSGRIVNTSGGGCPDIPFLNLTLVGSSLDEAPRPKEIGSTLCCLMLDRAFVECLRLLSPDGRP